jgi:Second Messenger Oligonucleotide or Dinucleotide Synthetase domain
MANCDKLFEEFLKEISIPSPKGDKMLVSKEKLRKRIRNYFAEHHPEYYPKFYIQGSYKMKTAIRTKLDICDLDDGVYFFREPDVTATKLQGWVWDAVNGYTTTTPEHRKKCIRNIFTGDYEIDMPVYYKVDDKGYQLAVKNVGWEDSDPKAMVNWFNKKKDKEGKLVEVVKSLKDWCDYKPGKMTTGLALSILAGNAKDKIILNDRKDVTIRDILKEIKKALDLKFECIVPAAPNDNLFADYDETREKNFMDALNDFVDDSDTAIKKDNQLAASKLWRKHFGKRFPLGEDKNENPKSNSRFAIGASLSNPWACDK